MSTRSKNSISERTLTRKYKKEMDKLLFIANTNEESVFQSNFKYIQFKTKKILEKIVCYDFVNVLCKLKFHEECIFWYERLLKETICTEGQEISEGNCCVFNSTKNQQKIPHFCPKAQLISKCPFRVTKSISALQS